MEAPEKAPEKTEHVQEWVLAKLVELQVKKYESGLSDEEVDVARRIVDKSSGIFLTEPVARAFEKVLGDTSKEEISKDPHWALQKLVDFQVKRNTETSLTNQERLNMATEVQHL